MGKVKSAIITAFLAVAIIVLALFAVISCDVPGTNHVKRYNSFLTSIRLGPALSGEASAILYPEGVLSDADYSFVVADEDENNADKREEYLAKYVKKGGLYVDKDKLADDDGAAFAESVKKDAEIMSGRFGQKGYSGYSVSVVDGYAVKVSVPTGFTYAAYTEKNASDRSDALSRAGHAITYLSLDGGLSLRSAADYDSSSSLFSINDDINEFIKSASLYGVAGNYALRIKLTDEGFEKFNSVLGVEDSDVTTAYLFVGETNLQLTFTVGTALTDKTMYFQSDKDYSQDYAIVIDSVVNGNRLQNVYNNPQESSSSSITASTPALGRYAAVWLFGLFAFAVAAAVACSFIKYKKLGFVNLLMILIYALALITAVMLIDIEVTVGGIIAAIFGLAVLCFANFFTFEAVRKETEVGRTMPAAVKMGYKKVLFGLLDLHVLLLAAAIILTLVGAGELASCGFILIIATIASYILYWFTRLMWYVISSPVHNKFGFCGFERRVDDDE